MLQKYYRFTKVAGVDIEIGKDGSISFSACLLNINGNQLNIDQKVTGLTDINNLKKYIPAGTITAINLTGKGVLVKLTDRIASEAELNFANILPNASQEDFYTQLFTSGDKSFVALVRRQEADRWITLLRKLDFIPISLSLGPFAISQIMGQLNIYGGSIVFNRHVVGRNEQQDWVSYKYEESIVSTFPFKLENEQVDGALLIPYASAFQLALYPNIALVGANIPELTNELAKRSGRVKLKAQGVVVLIMLFVLLLINFLLFNYYYSSNLSLAVEVGQRTKLAGNTASLADSLKLKQQLLATIGWEDKTEKSVMIDQMAQLLPAEISWQQVAIDPLGPNPDHSANQDVFAVRQIRVTGTSERLIPVNEWIARLKTRAWIKNVQLQSYYFNNELNTGQFTVAITY